MENLRHFIQLVGKRRGTENAKRNARENRKEDRTGLT